MEEKAQVTDFSRTGLYEGDIISRMNHLRILAQGSFKKPVRGLAGATLSNSRMTSVSSSWAISFQSTYNESARFWRPGTAIVWVLVQPLTRTPRGKHCAGKTTG
jgi:hypothetical protein